MKNKTIVITGASRGVGREIALRAARYGANVGVWAKTDLPHPKLSGTIYTVAEEIQALGGRVLPLKVDVRFADQVNRAAEETVAAFGAIDALINNASAIILDPTEKQVFLMYQVIVCGARFCTEACLPHLQKSENPHVINIAPSLPMAEHWVKKYGTYARAKRALGEYTQMMTRKYPGISFTALWPKVMLFTAATINLFGEEQARAVTRSPKIMADAAVSILKNRESGKFFLDETALKELSGVVDFSSYLLPGSKEEDLMQDIFV